MIGIVDVEVQAANPSMPLYPLRAFVNSWTSLRIRNVPKQIGKWRITHVIVSVRYPDGRLREAECVQTGGVWVGTVNGSFIPGISEEGYQIYARGVDENGYEMPEGEVYNLGQGLVEILNADGYNIPGKSIAYVHLLSADPSGIVLTDGDMWRDNATSAYYIYQDNNTYMLGGLRPSDLDFSLTAEGKAADAYAVGEQLNYVKQDVQSYGEDIQRIDGNVNGLTAVMFEVVNDVGYLKTDVSSINDLIPNQASTSNPLADKAFVNSSVQTATANFRGNWATWALVPETSANYPMDYAGSRVPTVNDYLVVQNASDYTAGELEGTWRFKYTAEWSDLGKGGWAPEYQVNETPMTAAQLAAINSNITAAKVTYYDDALNGLEQLINSL